MTKQHGEVVVDVNKQIRLIDDLKSVKVVVLINSSACKSALQSSFGRLSLQGKIKQAKHQQPYNAVLLYTSLYRCHRILLFC